MLVTGTRIIVKPFKLISKIPSESNDTIDARNSPKDPSLLIRNLSRMFKKCQVNNLVIPINNIDARVFLNTKKATEAIPEQESPKTITLHFFHYTEFIQEISLFKLQKNIKVAVKVNGPN